MKVVLLFTLTFAFCAGSGALGKRVSEQLQGTGAAGRALYFTVTGLFACVFFFVSSGFQLSADRYTLGYGLWYTVLVTVVMLMMVRVYCYFSVAVVSVITSAGSLILTSLCGFLIWQETVTHMVLLRIGLMMLAVVLVYFSSTAGETLSPEKTRDTPRTVPQTAAPRRKKGGRGILFITLQLVSSVLCTVVTKLYAAKVGSSDGSSLFFFVNVGLVLIGLGWLGVLLCKNLQQTVAELKGFPLRIVGTLAANTANSNASALVSVVLLQLVAVSVYTPVYAACGILGGVAVSLFRGEKLNAYLYAAAAVSVAAVALPG